MFAVAIVIRLHALNGRYGAFYVMHTGNCNSKLMHNFFCKYSWVKHGFSRQLPKADDDTRRVYRYNGYTQFEKKGTYSQVKTYLRNLIATMMPVKHISPGRMLLKPTIVYVKCAVSIVVMKRSY